MVHLLFLDVELAVVVNGELFEGFRIQRGVRQGCPLGPYLFLIVAQTLNEAAKAAMGASAFLGI
jgi:hypothetical protein